MHLPLPLDPPPRTTVSQHRRRAWLWQPPRPPRWPGFWGAVVSRPSVVNAVRFLRGAVGGGYSDDTETLYHPRNARHPLSPRPVLWTRPRGPRRGGMGGRSGVSARGEGG